MGPTSRKTQELAPVEAGGDEGAQDAPEQHRDAASLAGGGERAAAQRLDGRGQPHSGPSRAPVTNWRTTGCCDAATSAAGPS